MSRLTPAAAACPRCKQPLIDPNGLGWCKACGYCRSLQESEKQTAQEGPSAPAQPNTLTATTAAVGGLPRWVWVSLLGIVLIAGATFAVGHYVALSPLNRALLSTVQIGLGVLLMFVGQFIGLLRIAPEDSNLSFKDAIFPFRLYSLVFKHMPKSQTMLYFGLWGLTAIVSAAVFVGGLGHWLNYIPKSQGAQKTHAVR
jgi:hypothetical protein